MNPRIDARLQRDLDAKGFDKVSELGCRHYALKFDELNRQCVAWISCQLELARTRARYDHDEQEAVEEYQDQLAQCRQLAREVSARVHAERSELVPSPPLPSNSNKSQGADISINEWLTAWSEVTSTGVSYWYLFKPTRYTSFEATTDENRLVTKIYFQPHRVSGAFMRAVKERLPIGKPLLMSTAQEIIDSALPKVTARVRAEPNELVPAPPAIPKGRDTGNEVAIDKNKRMWAELNDGKITFAYWMHARTGVFVMVNTDPSRKIISHEVIGIFKREVDEKEINALLVKGKPLTMKMLEAIASLCKQQSVAARVSVDMNGGPLPERDFELDGRKWKFMQRGPTTWYDCELRKGVYLSLLISDGAIADAFVTIQGIVRKESADTKAKVMAIFDKNPKPTIENLRAFVAVLAPKHAVTARVASEKNGLVPRNDFSAGERVWSVQEGESSYLYKTKVAANTWLLVNVELDNKIDSVWLEDALMRQRPSKANNQLHEFLTRGTRPIATYDAFNTLVKIASRDRSFSLSALGSLTALEVIQACMSKSSTRVSARVASEKKPIERIGQLPSTLYVNGRAAKRGSVNTAYHSFDLVEYTCKIDNSVVSIPFFQNRDGTQTVTVRMAKSPKSESSLLCRLVSNEMLFPITLDSMLKRFNATLACEFKSFVITSKPSTRMTTRAANEGRRTTARVDFEKDMIANENEMPNVLKVCKGELMRHRGPRVYSGDLASHRNESVHVAVSIDMGLSAFRVYLEGNLITNKRCALRFPFTRSALEAYVEAELCGVID